MPEPIDVEAIFYGGPLDGTRRWIKDWPGVARHLEPQAPDPFPMHEAARVDHHVYRPRPPDRRFSAGECVKYFWVGLSRSN
jgi:hypothetical protein